MESHCPRTPTGHSIKGYGQYRTITKLSLQWGNLPKLGRMSIIYWQAITVDGFISRKTELFGQTRFTLPGTESRNLRQPEGFRSVRLQRVPGQPWKGSSKEWLQ